MLLSIFFHSLRVIENVFYETWVCTYFSTRILDVTYSLAYALFLNLDSEYVNTPSISGTIKIFSREDVCKLCDKIQSQMYIIISKNNLFADGISASSLVIIYLTIYPQIEKIFHTTVTNIVSLMFKTTVRRI